MWLALWPVENFNLMIHILKQAIELGKFHFAVRKSILRDFSVLQHALDEHFWRRKNPSEYISWSLLLTSHLFLLVRAETTSRKVMFVHILISVLASIMPHVLRKDKRPRRS